MRHIRSWLSRNKFEAHMIAFIMMVIAPIGMYFAAQCNAAGWIWALLCAVILANLLVVIVP